MPSVPGIAYSIEFFAGRRSRDQAISTVKQTANTVLQIASTSASKARQVRQAEHDKGIQDLQASSAEATRKREEGVKKSSEAAAKASADAMKPLSDTKLRAMGLDDDEIKKYGKAVEKTTERAEKAYARYVKRANKLGIEMTNAKSWSKPGQGRKSAQKGFGESDVEPRERAIKLTQKMIDELKHELKIKQQLGIVDEETQADLEIFEQQLREQINLQGDVIQLEKEEAKIKRKNGRAEREMEKEREKQQKEEEARQRELNHLMNEYAKHVEDAANQVKGTLKNAFVIGTAAAAAFFYKLNGVVQEFSAFENEIINAQSIWQVSNEQLFGLSDQIVQFGLEFGISMQDAAQGLYQYASAGVSANDAMEMLTHTLTLAMAVQGDHATLAKLTTQIIKGYNMEFTEAQNITDKLAHAINLSLIEWDDLASSVKFALPFFTATNQTLDTLLGALSVLTDRALEAGIAGRGLRQGLAEFAEGAMDSTASFHAMGIEILNAEGQMRPLTDIALQYKAHMDETGDSMAVMVSLMEDLNIRGATAFMHLVDGAEEFAVATQNIAGSSGEAMEMAEIMNQSLEKTMIRVKTAMLAPFFMSDEMVEINGQLNTFSAHLHAIAELFLDVFVTQLEDGTYQMTEAGKSMQKTVIVALEQLYLLLVDLRGIWDDLSGSGLQLAGIIKAFMVPLRAVTKLVNIFGEGFLEAVILWKLLNQLIPINSMVMLHNIKMQMLNIDMLKKGEVTRHTKSMAKSVSALTNAYWKLVAAQMAVQIALFAMMYATQKYPDMAGRIGMLTGAILGMVIAYNAWNHVIKAGYNPWLAAAGIVVTTALIMGAINKATAHLFKTPEVDETYALGTALPLAGGEAMAAQPEGSRAFDTGGYIYADSGLAAGASHRMVMVEPGERILSRAETNLGGGGITLNIGDVYANDGTDFADKVAEALPFALRNLNDIGGI